MALLLGAGLSASRALLCVLQAALALGLSASDLNAQPQHPPLETEKLNNASFINNIYNGQFDRIPVMNAQRPTVYTEDGAMGFSYFTAFVEVYSDYCRDHLRAPVVEIVRVVTPVTVRKNYYGHELGRTHGTPKQEPTGTFAEKSFGETYLARTNAAGFVSMMSMIEDVYKRRADSLAGALYNQLGARVLVLSDMAKIVAKYGCTSRQVRIFSENLHNYVRVMAPAHRRSALGALCAERIAKILPRASPQSCPCIDQQLSQSLQPWQMEILEKNFDETRFLLATIGKVGLVDRVAQCLK